MFEYFSFMILENLLGFYNYTQHHIYINKISIEKLEKFICQFFDLYHT